MSSRGKKKTTMAKLNREARLRERRSEKVARKERRLAAAAAPDHDVPDQDAADDEVTLSDEGHAEHSDDRLSGSGVPTDG